MLASIKASSHKSPPDFASLLRNIARHDHTAFAELYRATSAQLLGVVSSFIGRGYADEIVQEAFVRIWEHAAEFDDLKGSPMVWMKTIARNLALDELRRIRRSSLEDQPEGFEFADVFVDPLARRERTERYAEVIRGLQKLEPQLRDMILLAYYHGATREALARRYGAPTPTIKTWLRRGLKELRERLDS